MPPLAVPPIPNPPNRLDTSPTTPATFPTELAIVPNDPPKAPPNAPPSDPAKPPILSARLVICPAALPSTPTPYSRSQVLVEE